MNRQTTKSITRYSSSVSPHVTQCFEEIDSISSNATKNNNRRPMDKWAKPLLIGAWGFFVSYELAIGLDKIMNDKPICHYESSRFGAWFMHSLFMVLGCLAWMFIHLLQRSSVEDIEGAHTVPMMMATHIVAISSISTILSVVEWGGICVDKLNFASHAALWGEWIACGPLVIYTIFTISEDPDLTRGDWFIMITFDLCLIAGLVIIPEQQPIGWAWFSFVMSNLMYMPIFSMPYYIKKRFQDKRSQYQENKVSTTENYAAELSQAFSAERMSRCYKASVWLNILFPLYTLNYFICMGGGYSYSVTLIISQILSVFTKGLVTVSVITQIDMQSKATEALLRQANQAQEARRSFVKYVFHEVRTPLNSLSMGIDILGSCKALDLKNPESADVVDTLHAMNEAVSFMAETLDDILSLQKIEEDKFELSLGPVSIRIVIQKLESVFKGGLLSKGLTLESYVAQDVPAYFLGDRNRLEHVAANLLSNAIKFAKEKTTINISVKIALMSFSEGKRPMMEFSVEDHGCGISENDKRKLFVEFSQIKPNSLQKGKGSGLGLSFCKQIIRLHGGSVRVDSVEGVGSTFYFMIPLEVVEAPVIKEPCKEEISTVGLSPMITPDMPSAGASSVLKVKHPATALMAPDSCKKTKDSSKPRLSVLVVDDASSNRKMLGVLLARAGVEDISYAEDGALAVQAVFDNPGHFNLIFMDNIMPVLDGITATRTLRERGFDNLIIGVTGCVMEDEIAEYLRGGADAILGKPVKINALHALLRYVEEFGPVSDPSLLLSLVDEGTKYVQAPRPYLARSEHIQLYEFLVLTYRATFGIVPLSLSRWTFEFFFFKQSAGGGFGCVIHLFQFQQEA